MTKILNQYEQQAQEFLDKSGVLVRFDRIGVDCPPWCDDKGKGDTTKFPRLDHIHGAHYRAIFTRKQAVAGTSGNYQQDFWNSYQDEEKHYVTRNLPYVSVGLIKKHKTDGKLNRFFDRTPTAYDVLTLITKSDPWGFDEWCQDCGYDTDSRRAEQTHRAIVDEWRQVSRFFTAEELESMQEIQ